MKASELIKELEYQIKLHGDCEVNFVNEVEFEGCSRNYTLDMGGQVDYVLFDKERQIIRLG